MSENIQSISQGTFTIGSTSATNFEAGPGISITQPSEGTVRIANDETVLWSGTYSGTSAIPFTESYKNFDYVQINFKRSDNLSFVHTFNTNDQTYNEISLIGNWCRLTTAGGVSLVCSQYTLGDTSLQFIRGCEVGVGASPSNASANKIIVTKVIGINRKANA